jgi:hypothetical protein
VSALPPLRVTLLELLDYRQLTNVMSYEMALSMTLGAGMKWISSVRTPLTRSSSRVGPVLLDCVGGWTGLVWTADGVAVSLGLVGLPSPQPAATTHTSGLRWASVNRHAL